jgi:NitT/TauT family transport system permease protein
MAVATIVPATPGGHRAGLRAAVGGIQTVAGVCCYLALWEVVGRRQWFGSTFPPLSDIVETIVSGPQHEVIRRALGTTVRSSGIGFAIGVIAALLGTTLAVVVPVLRAGIDQFATIVHATPVIALAPLFIVTLGREQTPVAIAALAAGFAMFVAATSATEAARVPQHDVFTALGSSRTRRLLSLQLPAAVPGLVDGLRLAAPGAVLGAVLGEWFGAPRGLGVLIVSAMQNYQITLLWAAAVLAAGVSMAAFGCLTALARLVARRWAG